MRENLKYSKKRRVTLLTVAMAVLCGLVVALSSSTAVGAKPPPPPQGVTRAQWASIVAKARHEGTVVMYTLGNPDNVNKFAQEFQHIYGINVTVNRQQDAILTTQVTSEEGSGHLVDDVWVAGAKSTVLGALKNGWVSDAVGPNFFGKSFDRKKDMLGKSFIVGGAILGLAWNTQAAPTPVSGIPDLLKPEWTGKIAVVDPSFSLAVMDWYLWLDQTYGNGTMAKLAALKPQISASAFAATQAVVSGEAAASPLASPTISGPAAAAGAPVKSNITAQSWNTPYYAMILKKAPHPYAAQVLANFWVSKAGQTIFNAQQNAIYPDLQGTYFATPRKVNVNDFTKAKVANFQAQWKSMFQH